MLERDETALGAVATTRSPVLIDVYGSMGFDFVWLDHEHIGHASADGPNFESITRAAGNAGIEPLCRIESGDGHVIRKVLDAGIRSIIIPRIETADEVRQAIEAARFSFEGRVGDRGVGTSISSDWGDRSPSYTADQDSKILVGVMLENRVALENVEDILQVPHVGFGWIGPADLSVSLDHPIKYDHPDVEDAIETFRRSGHDHDIPIGIDAGYAGGVEEAIKAGYQLVSIGSEVGSARQVLGDGLQAGRNVD